MRAIPLCLVVLRTTKTSNAFCKGALVIIRCPLFAGLHTFTHGDEQAVSVYARARLRWYCAQ